MAASQANGRWMVEDEAAEYVRLSPRTLQKLRYEGKGPAYRKPGYLKRILYKKEDLDDWLESDETLHVERRGRRQDITNEYRIVHGQRVLVQVCPPAKAGGSFLKTSSRHDERLTSQAAASSEADALPSPHRRTGGAAR